MTDVCENGLSKLHSYYIVCTDILMTICPWKQKEDAEKLCRSTSWFGKFKLLLQSFLLLGYGWALIARIFMFLAILTPKISDIITKKIISSGEIKWWWANGWCLVLFIMQKSKQQVNSRFWLRQSSRTGIEIKPKRLFLVWIHSH